MRCRYRQLDIEFLRQKQSTGNKRADFVGYVHRIFHCISLKKIPAIFIDNCFLVLSHYTQGRSLFYVI